MENKRARSIPEFCQRWGVGHSKVYEEIAAGRLIARKFGARTLILDDDGEAWAKSLPILTAETAA